MNTDTEPTSPDVTETLQHLCDVRSDKWQQPPFAGFINRIDSRLSRGEPLGPMQRLILDAVNLRRNFENSRKLVDQLSQKYLDAINPQPPTDTTCTE